MDNERSVDRPVFVRLISALRTILGITTRDFIDRWIADTSIAMAVTNPIALVEAPGTGKIDVIPRPIHVVASTQSQMWMHPEIVEELGNVSEETCLAEPVLWNIYRSTLKSLAAQKASVVAPTTEDVINLSRAKHAR